MASLSDNTAPNLSLISKKPKIKTKIETAIDKITYLKQFFYAFYTISW